MGPSGSGSAGRGISKPQHTGWRRVGPLKSRSIREDSRAPPEERDAVLRVPKRTNHRVTESTEVEHRANRTYSILRFSGLCVLCDSVVRSFSWAQLANHGPPSPPPPPPDRKSTRLNSS